MKKYILIFIYVISSVYAWTQSENTTIPYYYSDTTWERYWGYSQEGIYMEPFWSFDPFTSYDRGFLFGICRYDSIATAHAYLVKTDNNGYQLWQKKILINDKLIAEVDRKRLLPNGNILISALYFNDKNIQTPVVCLLNPCCEVIWAKELRVSDRLTFATDVQIDNEGNIVVVLVSNSKETQPYYEDQCRLIKMTADGKVIFERMLYKHVNPNDVFVQRLDLYIDKDNYYYLFAPYYFNGLDRSEFITKLNSEAEEVWEIDTKLLDQQDFKQPVPPTSYYMPFYKMADNGLRLLGAYVGYIADDYRPYILDITTEGDVINIEQRDPFRNHDTISNYFYSSLHMQPLDKDSLLFASMFFYTSHYAHPSAFYLGYIVFDRELNPYSYKINIDDIFGSDHKEGVTVDNGQFLLPSGRIYPDYETCIYEDVRLAKYNADLSYADVIDDSNWTYDSLCPYVINNDPINIVPEIYDGVSEYGTVSADNTNLVTILVQPNPTAFPIRILVQGVERVKIVQLSIVDIQGQTLWQQAIKSSGTIDISNNKGWASGVYSCVAHDSQGRIVGNTKLLIK